ncbi:trans-aconitate 2-methyltransferase [Apibacter sp. HY039]|uniref:class I SAM-dependent methyltransferase n=1 Tax=Apibacter sp. HY039 TaxID=2501476 RepID=UPI002103F8ED|nr:class I SAM-dependent methyltransferase [Apibacter sp. HY039]
MPYYKEMIHAIVAAIPFSSDKEIDVMDLGCGTGTISLGVREKYSLAKFTMVDIAENMIRIAQQKLGITTQSIHADFNDFNFDKQYDVIISSLALHHLETDADKQLFYNKIYKALKKEGIFINGDVVKAQTEQLQETFTEEWVNYMKRSVDIREIEEKWLPNYYAEDRPISLMNHLAVLGKSGFKDIDVIWKYYGFSVYKGSK